MTQTQDTEHMLKIFLSSTRSNDPVRQFFLSCETLSHLWNFLCIITARIRSLREVNVFSQFTGGPHVTTGHDAIGKS